MSKRYPHISLPVAVLVILIVVPAFCDSNDNVVYINGRSINDFSEIETPVGAEVLDTSLILFPTPGPFPTGITWDGQYSYIADYVDGVIYKVNSAGGVADTIDSPTLFPAGLEHDGHNLWLVGEQECMLYKMSPTTGAVLASFELPDPDTSGFDPNSWGIAWDGENLWNSHYGEFPRLYKLDTLGVVLDSLVLLSTLTSCLGIEWDGTFIDAVSLNDQTYYRFSEDNGNPVDSYAWPVPFSLGIEKVISNFWSVSSDSTQGGAQAVYYIQLTTDVIETDDTALPTAITALDCYPNPFNANTSIRFSLADRSNIRIDIYNILGSLVKSDGLGSVEAGSHSYTWQADRYPSGVYFINIDTGIENKRIKAVLLK